MLSQIARHREIEQKEGMDVRFIALISNVFCKQHTISSVEEDGVFKDILKGKCQRDNEAEIFAGFYSQKSHAEELPVCFVISSEIK